MAELIVLGFKNEAIADEVVPLLEHLQSEGLLELADWARVSRRQDGKIDVRQATSTTGLGAASGALFGMLFGLLFLMPLAGIAVGAITGAVMGKLSDIGISDTFIKEVGNQITPGTSALFLYVTRITTDRVVARLRDYEPTVIRTSLSEAAEEQLRSEIQGQPAA